ncbi:MAG: hypothetical protein BGO51_13725 [Rhodospirillales bacterium 69-11]|nr:hypothetical protein [Rhodospirillales bacterium]MBN8925509.1 hypothetical protein [Rhodospirillales bacterium]OJW26388.1 MAG: hypothetical protein BGO51_13725 [Rhodospirillales bacterium 69-11]
MGDGMRAVKIAAVVMGVLILLGTAGLITALVLRKPNGPATVAAAVPASLNAVLEEPAGSHIVGISTIGDRLAVALSGGGPDRVVLLDPRTGGVAGRISLGR